MKITAMGIPAIMIAVMKKPQGLGPVDGTAMDLEREVLQDGAGLQALISRAKMKIQTIIPQAQ